MRLPILLSLLSTLLPLALSRPWTLSDPCPTTIKTTIASDPCKSSLNDYRCTSAIKFSNMDCVHLALSTCPNISALDLRVTGLGCSDWPERYDFPFHPWGGEKFANLTSLRLEGYNFGRPGVVKQPRDDNAQPWLGVQWMRKMMSFVRLERTEQGLIKPAMKTHLDLWLDAMDWGQVEELMIDDITDEIMQKLPGKLRSLKKLETKNRTFVDALEMNTLTHLNWVGKSEASDFLSILARQGQSLQHLEFRRPERPTGPFLADFDIGLLPNMTRNLTHISINVPRNGTWPLDTLSVMASLPKLRSADIFMNIQSPCAQQRPNRDFIARSEWREKWMDYCVGEDQFQQPFVNKTGAEMMLMHMKEQREEKGLQEMANVTFYVGDWTRGWDGPLYFPEWLEGKAAKVVCKTEGMAKDDWCVVERGEGYWKDGYRDPYYDDDDW